MRLSVGQAPGCLSACPMLCIYEVDMRLYFLKNYYHYMFYITRSVQWRQKNKVPKRGWELIVCLWIKFKDINVF